MAKGKQSLEEGLDHSANKRGFTGAKRHQYIGGAIRNMEKRGALSVKPRAKKATSAPAHKPAPKAHVAPSAKPAPKKAAYNAPTMVKREFLDLEVKVNKKASEGKPTARYSIYNKKTKAQYSGAIYISRKGAVQAAKNAMDAHNHPKGVHTQNRFF